ncbi:lysylphosphatidylglycerol synthase transmembrane domain-containing protein [Aquisediminimonas sediminicola]|uniref:lysylphosphatidylglycerol synthase transmembrane domain-containing protein n=1 Tax=Alteraquisediminimonas sediminicola TaxID=2676787 RepID=UPI001C8D46DB|nr:lysylphosphatidylglycerol synthase transmembrane domain-containing protein [Aquisediminimonas sediminicola]
MIGLIVLIRREADFSRFVVLAEQAQPLWLALAILLQLGTYASLAFSWRIILRRAGEQARFPSLIRIALVKLFIDQTLPTAGMSGNILLVDQLIKINVSRGIAVAALLMSMIGYYTAYVIFAVLVLWLLWWQGNATPFMASVIACFMVVAILIPGLALWLRHRGRRPLPDWLAQIGPIEALFRTVGLAPADLLRDRHVLARVTLCNALIFCLDAATLYACLHGLGQDVGFATALIGLIMASVAVTLAPLPFGLGSFEVACTATLHLLGISIEAAFASTMLLRALTLWLPLVPGLILLRRRKDYSPR